MSANPLAPFPRGCYGLSPWICTDVRDSFVTNRTSKMIHITFEAMQCLPGSLGALAVGDPRCHVRNPTTLRPSCCWGHVEVLQPTAQLNSQPTTKLPDVWVSHFARPAQWAFRWFQSLRESKQEQPNWALLQFCSQIVLERILHLRRLKMHLVILKALISPAVQKSK